MISVIVCAYHRNRITFRLWSLTMKDLRYINMHKQSHQYWIDKMQSSRYIDADIDSYNQGELMRRLEQRVAKLLGKEQALFFHKGTIAQLAALRVAADRRVNHRVALHPQSHIVVDESDAYQLLMGLKGVEVGVQGNALNYQDIAQIEQPVGSVCIELPLRRAGFKLAPWSDLESISAYCKAGDIHLHMDGARLWESVPYYCAIQQSTLLGEQNKRSFAESETSKTQGTYLNTLSKVSSLFDSVYVSLYKGLGGMGGSVLAGDASFIEDCRTWRHRLGGTLWTVAPMLMTALDGLDNNLPAIENWVIRANELAVALSKIDGLKVNQPQTNSFVVYIRANLAEINRHAEQLTQETGLKLFTQFFESEQKGWQAAEIQVLTSEKLIKNTEIVEYFRKLIDVNDRQ
jgi:threonine aldolase